MNTLKSKSGGLEGIVAASTALSKVEGSVGRLIYRGYNIHDLAGAVEFEEVVSLLWFAQLPDKAELEKLKSKLAAQRKLPSEILQSLKAMPKNTEPMDALRTAVSVWGAVNVQGKPTVEQSLALTALFPVIIAAFDRIRKGKEPLQSQPELGHAANYLYLLTGEIPTERHLRALNAYLVLLADHGMNASTFTARVVASTESDLVSAVVAAVGALKGPLHGGAPSKVMDMLKEIGQAEKAESWLQEALDNGEKIMGFGHRVYKTEDPRAEELRRLAKLADPKGFELACKVEKTALEMFETRKQGRRIYTNVEFYSAVLLAAVGLSGDLFTPTFAASRVAGWTAHILEQTANNRIIRPEAEYTGPEENRFVEIGQRVLV